MPISMPNIPPNTLLPLFYAEVTRASEPISPNLKLCLIGHMNKGSGFDEGDGVDNYPFLLSGNQATHYFGRGSMLERMYNFARSNAPFAEIWGVAVPEAEGAFRQVMRLTVTRGGSDTFYGTAGFWIGGQWVPYPIQKTSTPTSICGSIRQAINDRPLHYKTISYSGNTVDVACRWMGGTADMINFSYGGCTGRADLASRASWLARNSLTWTRTTIGSGESTAATALAILQDRPFDVFALPYAASVGTYMTEMRDFMDHDSGRWAPNRQKYGHMFGAIVNQSFMTMWERLVPHYDPHMSILAIKNTVLPPWCWSSALAAKAVVHWSAPPELSRPLQTIQLRNCCAGSDDDESFTRVEKQTLLEAGGSTVTIRDDYQAVVDRIRTTQKRNDADTDPDYSWADAVTMFQAMYFVKQMRQRITGAYPRCALSTIPTGINGFTSPAEIRSVIIHEYKRMQAKGLVENFDLFSRYLIVERNMDDRNRVDVLMRPDFINQLRVVAALVETHLELDASDPTLLAAA